jgi:hypothetical protein
MMTTADLTYFLDLNNASKGKDVADVCIANISLEERKKRLRFGIQQFIITLVILGVMILLHLNPLWRLPLLLLFWASAVGYFQARDKT